MDQGIRELAAAAVAMARDAGANASRVQISTSRQVDMVYREREPEAIKEATSRGLLIELYANGRYSGQWTSDLRRTALESFITDAVRVTKLLEADPDRSLPDPRYYEGRAEVDLGIFCGRHGELTPAERHRLVSSLEQACLDRGGARIISARASMTDNHVESFMLTSNGFEGYTESTVYRLGSSVTAQDEGDRRPMAYHGVVVRQRSDLADPAAVGIEAAERALDLLGATRLGTETLPIIVENRNVARLLNWLITPMSGRAVQQRQSYLAERQGRQIGGRAFTLIDEPFLRRGLGSTLWDADGIATRRRTMVEAGTLRDFYIDWYYSRKLGVEPTTGAPTNLVIPPGQRNVTEIMRDLRRGILITGFIGGSSNPTTGDQSVGIAGKLFENGEPTQAVAEMNIAGNMLPFWSSLVEVANDPWSYGSVRTPSLVFRDVVVSGA